MNNIEIFNKIIDFIEANLTGDIDINTIAQQANMSLYEFRRIFSFIAGIPLGEYIRKRRLSCAAEDLIAGKDSITEIASRYGYDSPTAFSRSFKAFHGVSPTEVIHGSKINMCTRIDFTFCARGGKDIAYRIAEDTSFFVNGYTGLSDDTDTECCEKVWNAFYDHEELQSGLHFPEEKIYAAYENNPDGVTCHIGERAESPSADFESIRIPASKWACFQLCGADDAVVNAFYEDILFRWSESGKYKRNPHIPNLEVFPVNMDDDDFLWEIRIPLL